MLDQWLFVKVAADSVAARAPNHIIAELLGHFTAKQGINNQSNNSHRYV